MAGWMSVVVHAFDTVFAPAGAFDAHSDAHCADLAPTPRDEPEAAWHNAWGTAADYQVPAESGNSWQSNGWSGSSDWGGGGFSGGDW